MSRNITIGRPKPRSMLLFPTQCLGRSCGRVFFGPGHLCEQCAAKRDARRASVRKRLGRD